MLRRRNASLIEEIDALKADNLCHRSEIGALSVEKRHLAMEMMEWKKKYEVSLV